ncbi:MAG: MGMT family protein [Candidatus Aenigmarchaeota archaeon]|nr:MGMT family protein [Candidatus Aenigmarchaeota archaeon]
MSDRTFYEKVWELLRQIPKGRVTTYGEIAKKLNTKAYRAVGNACNKNPYSPVAACHRVVNSDGRLGGFASGSNEKIKILRKEGIKVKNGGIIDFKKVLYKFDTK